MSWRRFLTVGVLFLWCAGTAFALAPSGGAPHITLPAVASLPPCPIVNKAQEAADQTVLKSALDLAHQSGLRALEPRLAELKQALGRAPAGLAALEQCDGKIVVTTSFADFMIYALTAGGQRKDRTDIKGVVFEPSPYPTLAFLIGTYYDEIGEYGSALQYLRLGLAMQPNNPNLVSEAATSLSQLKRFDESLALIDGLLSHAEMLDNPNHGRLLRSRGTALEGLGRLDDAAAAYTASLNFAPANPVALNELKYIASLRAGAPQTDTRLTLSTKSPPN